MSMVGATTGVERGRVEVVEVMTVGDTVVLDSVVHTVEGVKLEVGDSEVHTVLEGRGGRTSPF